MSAAPRLRTGLARAPRNQLGTRLVVVVLLPLALVGLGIAGYSFIEDWSPFDGHMEFNPVDQALMQEGDTLIVMGRREQLDRAEGIAGGSAA